MVSTVDSAVDICVVNFEDLLNQFGVVMNYESVVSSIGQSLNGRINFNSDIFFASIMRNFPHQFVYNGIQSCFCCVLLVSVVLNGSVLVGKIKLLVDPIVGFFQQKYWRSDARNYVAFTLRLSHWRLRIILSCVWLKVGAEWIIHIGHQSLLVSWAWTLKSWSAEKSYSNKYSKFHLLKISFFLNKKEFDLEIFILICLKFPSYFIKSFLNFAIFFNSK